MNDKSTFADPSKVIKQSVNNSKIIPVNNSKIVKEIPSKLAFISPNAYDETKSVLNDSGYSLIEVYNPGQVSESVETHPDIFICKQEFAAEDIYQGDLKHLSTKYPGEACYNACVSGEFFVHNLKITEPSLISWADSKGLRKVHVPQGYTRCNLLPISPISFITEDVGIWTALKKHTDMDVLKVSGKATILPGHPYGFLPGSAGIIRDSFGEAAVLFNGDIRRHPDYPAIENFIGKYGLNIIGIPDKPLVDIGSIICIN